MMAMRLLQATKIHLCPAEPEFVDNGGLERLFGIPRRLAMRLKEQGKLRAVFIREKDHVAGKWLWDCSSVRRLLNAPQAPPKGQLEAVT
jgi:hypothetical protein